MDRYRRQGRWLKRTIIFLIAYVAIGYVFLGVSPGRALLHPGATFASYRSMAVYLIFISFTAVIYFVAIFGFLARGTTYTIYPNEYDVSFDDVRG